MRTRAIVSLFLLMIVAAACGEDDSETASPDTTAPSSLAGTYLSTAVTGRDLVAGTQVSVTFDDGTISLNAGCNTLGGDYRLDGNQLVADQLGGTEMGCDTARHDQDAWLASFFASKPAVSVAGDTLTLTGSDAVLTLRDREVVQPDKPLIGTTWVIDTIIDGEAASTVPGEPNATIEFPTDTRVEVYDGCNRTSGAVEVEGDSVTVVDLPAPVRANCAGKTPVDYTAVLDGSVAAEIDADRLTLTGPDGKGFGLHAA
jgi:heat shock protein HslJ